MRFRNLISAALFLLLGASLLSVPLARMAFLASKGSRVTIVVDPGHGGEDGGAVSADGLRESDLNLVISLQLDRLLGLCGVPCRLTRDSDRIAYPDSASTTRQRKRVDQEYRAALIRSTEKAVLLSIHQNNYPSAGPEGPQVFYGAVSGSESFAKEMQSLLTGLNANCRTIAPIADDIYLMRQAACPAILVECGFLSNPQELMLLKSEEYRTKLALVLAAGCIRQYRELEAHYGEG